MAARLIITVALLVLTAHGLGPDEVPFSPVRNALERSAVCLDGSPAGYHLAPGNGDGASNWIVYLMGGGWCPDISSCQNNRTSYIGSTKSATTQNFTGILSHHQATNPDFYNWNRIYVYYCDQSSFLGDTEIVDVDQGLDLQFRGSRNFDAVIDDLLAKGMSRADNAILAGRSAGGLATILHCDDFRARLPNAGRVKCISDAGFFIRGIDLPNADYREHLFASTISFHNISSLLPTSCTETVDPSLCLFPRYLVGGVQTPLFILNSAFDIYQIQNNLVPRTSDEWAGWNTCLQNLQNCPSNYKELIKDFQRAFLNELRKIRDIPSRGLFIHTCFAHTITTDKDAYKYWNLNSTLIVENMTVVQAVGDWYFDRGSVKMIDTEVDFPRSCG